MWLKNSDLIVKTVFTALLIGCSIPSYSLEETPSKVHSDVIWQASFEGQTLDGWNYLLHPLGIQISNEHAFGGEYAAKISLEGSQDFIWYNNPKLNRSEMQYKPNSVIEGKQTHMRFSFMLPELFTNSRHEFAYWESTQSYQQLMRFNLAANRLSFSPAIGIQKNKTLWTREDLQPGVWYTIDMRILWSSSESLGRISIYLDGKSVLSKHSMQTLLKNEAAFIQLGILRDQTDLVETIWIDEVLELSTDWAAQD